MSTLELAAARAASQQRAAPSTKPQRRSSTALVPTPAEPWGTHNALVAHVDGLRPQQLAPRAPSDGVGAPSLKVRARARARRVCVAVRGLKQTAPQDALARRGLCLQRGDYAAVLACALVERERIADARRRSSVNSPGCTGRIAAPR